MKYGRESSGFNIFSTNGVVPHGGAPLLSGPPMMAQGRADHARMLAHAAARRLAAHRLSPDRAYWKAGAPIALSRAISIRQDKGLAKLP